MRAWLFAGALTLFSGWAVAQDVSPFSKSAAFEAAPVGEAKVYLDRALDLLEKRHINGATADWRLLRQLADREAAGAFTPGQTYQAIRSVIRALGERHTSLRTPDQFKAINARRATAALPTGRITSGVAVLALPSLVRDPTNVDDRGASYEQAIEAFVKDSDTQNVCGWIIDLRGHSGGDMWPAMRGLGPLLGGEGPVGAFVEREARKPWPTAAQLSRYKVGTPNAPIALILGPKTASSGEAVAIAFNGRAATRTFGQPTAGLTTGNSSVRLSDGALLVITSSFEEDRLGHKYQGPIVPDENVPMEQAEAAAMSWLANKGCGSRSL